MLITITPYTESIVDAIHNSEIFEAGIYNAPRSYSKRTAWIPIQYTNMTGFYIMNYMLLMLLLALPITIIIGLL